MLLDYNETSSLHTFAEKATINLMIFEVVLCHQNPFQKIPFIIIIIVSNISIISKNSTRLRFDPQENQ